MSELDAVLDHLRALVGFDTCNPPRNIRADAGLFPWLRQQLPGFRFQLEDSGNGCISLLAERGEPELLFNFHVDTVPANEKWQRDPFRLQVEGDRAYGLGACDIKGAAACMLAAVAQSDGPVALLFSSDEEAGNSTCIRNYLKHNHYRRVVVAEPTGAQAVLAHRGIGTAVVEFAGVPGHASAARALEDSAIHRMGRWLDRALRHVEQWSDSRYLNLGGIRFNAGRVVGGIKPNMIAGDCELKFGLRSLPAQQPEALLNELVALAEPGWIRHWETGFLAPALPADDAPEALQAGRALADELGLPQGEAVDFWTEASLFSQAGCAALVFGPGDIAQAHTADEWVRLDQLETVLGHYRRILAA